MRLVKTIHHCAKCDFYFPNPRAVDNEYAEVDSSGRYSNDLIRAGVEAVDCCRSLSCASRLLAHFTGVRVPITTIHKWWIESDLYAERQRQLAREKIRDQSAPLFA